MRRELVQLGDYVELVMGQAPPGDACNKEGIGTVFVKAGEFQERSPTIREWTSKPLKFANTKDTLVCVVGATAGKVNLANFDCAIGRSVAAVRPIPEKIDSLFLFHFLLTTVTQLREKSQGAAQGVITREMIQSLRLALPPIQEQRRIATILDQADALRAKRREALALLDELQRGIFIEMFGEYHSENCPWPVESFEQIAIDTKIGLVRGAEEFGPDFDVPYVRMNAIGRSGEFYPGLVLRTNTSEQELAEFALKPGDFLFNTRNSRELVGKTALFREQGKYVYNNNLMRIRFKPEIEPEYVAAAFLTPYIQHELEVRKAGTTSVFAIYARELKSLPIPIPPLARQEAFADRVKTINNIKNQNQLALSSLDKLFSSLQHRAFQGEL